jgi:tRNA threonylcarbamoyladenosine biosynthesis protein TsaB
MPDSARLQPRFSPRFVQGMPSLQELRASHAPLLLLDAASARIQVGWLGRTAAEDRWAEAETEAGIGLFTACQALQLDPAVIRAFVFCDGPGSILGIRTSAMALRTWNVLQPRPMFGYCSLAVVAHALNRPDAQIIADARRETWHRYVLGGQLQRVPTAELSGPLVMPEGFRHWTTPPPGVTSTPYRLPGLLAAADRADLFTLTDSPDAFLHEEPGYKTWTPQIHRAP